MWRKYPVLRAVQNLEAEHSSYRVSYLFYRPVGAPWMISVANVRADSSLEQVLPVFSQIVLWKTR